MHPATILVLTAWCLALSITDLREHRLPNALTLPGALAALGYGFAVGKPTLALLGALLLALPYLAVHLCMPRALGAGDVKLAFGLGAMTALAGPATWMWSALAAPMLTAAAGVGVLLTPGRSARARREIGGSVCRVGALAHGPAMCVASVIALLARR